MNLQEYKKTQYPFEEYLREIYAKEYMGTNDDMSDDFDSWLSNLDGEEYIKHGDVFARILLDLIGTDTTSFSSEKYKVTYK